MFHFQPRNILSPRMSQVWWKIILMIATIRDLFSSQITFCAVLVTTVLMIRVTAMELFRRMYNLRNYIYICVCVCVCKVKYTLYKGALYGP